MTTKPRETDSNHDDEDSDLVSKQLNYVEKKQKIPYLAGLIVIFIIAISLFYFLKSSQANLLIKSNSQTEVPELGEELKPEFRSEYLEIESGDTFGVVMAKSNLEASLVKRIYDESKSTYDLANLQAGYKIELIYHLPEDSFYGFIYKINTEEELALYLIDDEFQVELRPIPYEKKMVVKKGIINNSLYLDALELGIDERAIISLANAFQWTLDFAMDPRVGDKFSFIYEEKYLDGEYIRPGRALAGKYLNEDKAYYLYYFEAEDGSGAYYDQNGNSVQKMFLKAPLEFKYISSGFTTGLRYIKAFNVSTGHRAIDYAAAIGTPIRSVGDGTISFAGWNGNYGYMVSVRHNGTYSTNYAHMSKMAVKAGERVKQGQIIGYVGSTGFSTGPHLHYEMVKNGVKINPLTEVLPPGEPLAPEAKERFLEKIKPWQEILDN